MRDFDTGATGLIGFAVVGEPIAAAGPDVHRGSLDDLARPRRGAA